MKKEYIKPSIEATEIEAQMMMAASMYISDETTDANANMSNDRRRGTWGNLWR